MQRVKAHELRQKDEKGLVEELTKFRVIAPSCLIILSLERTRSVESYQSFRRPPGQARTHHSKLKLK